MPVLPGIGGLIGSAKEPDRGVKLLGAMGQATGPNFVFNGVNLGEPGTGRKLLIATFMSDNGTMSNFTIGGVAPAYVYNPTATAQILPRFWAMDCPPSMGTSAQALVTINSQDNFGMAIWSVFGWDGSTVLQSFNSGSGAATTLSAAFTSVPNGGALIGVIRNVGSLASTWTNADEVFDQQASGSLYFSGAQYQNLSGSAISRTVTGRAASGTSNSRGIAISIPISLT